MTISISSAMNNWMMRWTETDLTPQQETAFVEINVVARLQALKISFLILASIALLAVIPAGGLPNYVPKEVPAEIAPEIE